MSSSDDEAADPELLALLAKSLGMSAPSGAPPEIPVLGDAEFIYDNAVDVALDASSCKRAAQTIYESMQHQQYSPATWSQHELHPKEKSSSTADFIFTMDLLNFCFWTGSTSDTQFTVEYLGKAWTGYWALVACLQRALAEGIPITTPAFWVDSEKCSDEVLAAVFRSSTDCKLPLLHERFAILREAGQILMDKYDGSFLTAIEDANGSAARLLTFLVQDFPMFRDEVKFEGRRVRLYKRVQILIADLWAAFEGKGLGHFEDIDEVTVFADYRIPQMLQSLGCLQYSPKLHHHINAQLPIKSGTNWETEIRGCTIWCVELIRREIMKQHTQAQVNAILIDFFLYDTCKKSERQMLPHHRTTSIWY